MTDQTVSVPVDLLKTMKEHYPSTTSGSGVLAQLAALIPAPLKAGDVLTDVGQIADLPDTTVIVDRDGDVYVVGAGAATRVTDRLSLSSEVRTRVDLGTYAFSAYGPFTLHYVPEDK